MKNVAGKIALITGGAMGMGRLVAFRCARDGARIVIWDMNSEATDKTVKELKAIGADAHGYIVDVTDIASVGEAAEKVKREVGDVDILVNNAGIVAGGGFLEVPIETHAKVIDVNINGVMYCTHAFLPGMIESKAGHIVNIASAAGLIGVAGVTSYSASKFAVVGFTEALRTELRKMKLKDIQTTTVCPSFVDTGMFAGVKAPMFTPLMTPEEMADKIYEGLRKDKIMVKAPRMVKYIPIFKALSHPNHFSVLGQVMGVHSAMDKWTGRN